MSKEKISKKIARLNSKEKNKESQNKTPEQIKKQKIIKWSLLGVFSSILTAMAIGIPLGVSNISPRIAETRKPDTQVASIISPNNVLNITVSDLEKISKTESVANKEEFDQAKISLVKFLYEEEYKASKIFKNAWDKSFVNGKTSANSRFNSSLKSYDEVKETQRKFLEDERRRYQRSYGFQNWETEFNKYLSTDPKFGGSADFEKAIEYLTYKDIESKAFARFTPQFSTQFLYKDVKNRILSEDIKDENNNVIFKKGDRLFKDLIILDDSDDKGDKEVNAFIPNIEKTSDVQKTEEEKLKIKDEYRVSAFLTNSYVKDFINANEVVKRFYFDNDALLKDKFAFYSISQLTINATQNDKNANESWKIAKNDLKELLKYKVTAIDSSTQNASEVKTTLEIIENFKGNSTKDLKNRENDRILLNTINSSTNKENSQNLGQLPLRNLNQIFDTEDVSYAISFLDNLFSAKETNQILSTTLFNKLKEKLFTNSNASLLPDASTLNNKKLIEINEINRKIDDFIDKLDEGELKKAGDAFKETFGESDNQSYRISTIYKLSKNNFIIYSKKGLNIIAKEEIKTFDKLKELIKAELQLNANGQNDSSIKSNIKLNELFKELQADSIVLKQAINQKTFTDLLLKEHKANKSEEEKTKYIDSLKRNIENQFITYNNIQILAINSKIESYLNDIKKYNLNSDYNYENTKHDWFIKNKEEQNDVQTIYLALQKHFGLIK
ncbi:HinT-interacting membrane complex protein P80 [Mesomycoplasma molare]|uniref:Membrane protein P80 n=1 Tax=Mesomycoplasma molare TaxID=171288 RepID=A0ABY5TUI6_9BACT|nr:hypothetical protein [Mesomycoplasma molare]UWD34324.1 hypothetical protein NX772_00640 [Mesomycoplasma molare]